MSITQLLITAAVATLGAIACSWKIPRAWRGDDYQTRNDQAAAWRQLCGDPPAEQQQPGTDHQLYLDCIAVYGDCDELQRLRDAINETREGEK